MARRSVLLAFSVLVISTAPFLYARAKHSGFIPPDIATASDLNYPMNSGVSGVVAVAVSLDGAGLIKGTEVLRDIPSLTAPVLLAIDTWTFKPAMLDGTRVNSTIIVTIVFNPGDYRLGGATTPVVGTELRALSPDAIGFLPPQVISAPWAEYPLNGVAQGAVILDCHVSPAGRVTQLAAVSSVPSLTAPSLRAARNWTFKSATLTGTPTAANAVVGYVFRPSNIATPIAEP
jgi:hypothetical protein